MLRTSVGIFNLKPREFWALNMAEYQEYMNYYYPESERPLGRDKYEEMKEKWRIPK